jgi:hypothetical protein
LPCRYLSSLPTSTTVTQACLGISISNGSAFDFPGYELLRDWNENQVTWNAATSSANWASPGASAHSDHAGAQVTIPHGTTGWIWLAVPTSLAQKWISTPANNRGLLFMNSAATDGVLIASQQAASSRPTLRIVH